MKKLLLPALLVALVLVAGRGRAAGPFQVVVHRSNPVATLTKDQVSKMFLKKVQKWDSGAAVAPVDQSQGSQARAAFSKAVHGKGTAAVAAYWQQQIFAGREVPPPERASDAAVIEFVKANPGAIGYVGSASSEVKVIAVE